MTAKICKNCAFFNQKEMRPYEIEIYGENIGSCTNDNFVYVGDDKIPESGLGYGDVENYSAFFYVKTTFGCINYKK